MKDATFIGTLVVEIVFVLVGTFLIPFLRGKISAAQLGKIQAWTKIAVEAAELLFPEAGTGERKKAYVEAFLNAKGFLISAKEKDALIESSVMQMKNDMWGE